MKTKHKIFLICACALTLNILAAGAGYCDESKQEMNKAIMRFFMAMGGVVLSSFILFAGLSLYNKFFVNKRGKGNNPTEDSLETPKNVEDATTFFIKRNKLQ